MEFRKILYSTLGLLLVFSCTETRIIDPELETVISIEASQSQRNIQAGIFENSNYPCIVPSTCEPTIIEDAIMSLRGSNGNSIILNEANGKYFNDFPLQFDVGERVTLQVNTNTTSYQASAILPDSSQKVIITFYNLAPTNRGLFIRLDTNNLALIDALYIQVFARSNSAPLYGYIISSDLQFSASQPNNGFHDPNFPDVYFIPDSELKRSDPNFKLNSQDEYVVSARSITTASADFYFAFKRALREGNFSLNNGLFFAPPQNLPTNFDNEGFGMFHLFHEQIISGTVP